MTEALVVRRETHIAAPPATVFAFLTDPDKILRWMGSEVVPPGSSLVEIDLIDRDGGTLLRMTHSGLPDAAQCAGHDKGWAHYLGRLAEAAAGRDPGADPPHVSA